MLSVPTTARGYLRHAKRAELTMNIRWCMGVTLSKIMEQGWQNAL